MWIDQDILVQNLWIRSFYDDKKKKKNFAHEIVFEKFNRNAQLHHCYLLAFTITSDNSIGMNQLSVNKDKTDDLLIDQENLVHNLWIRSFYDDLNI